MGEVERIDLFEEYLPRLIGVDSYRIIGDDELGFADDGSYDVISDDECKI
jgi:hypothetical protein